MNNEIIDPPVSKEKCYNFEIEVASVIKGYVWAESFEDALELIESKKWEEIEDEKILSVENINSIAEDNS